ncbi:(2Fe-2S)-binding protein [Thiospirochaeta perfilievii]|uniref:(2Fe-2S)-binding protein n=1 Tax=Thiospirochaeta perfilievii TaxID=252967 RepID=A0A5C1QBF6_9SPIO|nr:(2Fe-2S)-binding protein [Thiospirochaeta perfilievii]QEN05395.1 (2Fe-2S)-binding protein [Thiospirochaeta perfilievii]
MTEEEIKDRYKKVCICRSVSKGTIKQAIKDGAKNVADVRRRTGATSGACKGSRCTATINDIIKEVIGN